MDSASFAAGDRVVTLDPDSEPIGGVVQGPVRDERATIVQDVPVGCTPKIFSLPLASVRRVSDPAEIAAQEESIAEFCKENPDTDYAEDKRARAELALQM